MYIIINNIQPSESDTIMWLKEELDDDNNAVFQFLDKLGLAKYAKIIIDEGFDDLDTFKEIEDYQLKELGVKKMGHRMKILKSIKNY